MYTDEELDDLGQLINQIEQKTRLLGCPQYRKYQWLWTFDPDNFSGHAPDSLDRLNDKIQKLAEQRVKPFRFPDSVRMIYRSIDGNLLLDNQYTIIGKVVKDVEHVERMSRFRLLTLPHSNQPAEVIRIKFK